MSDINEQLSRLTDKMTKNQQELMSVIHINHIEQTKSVSDVKTEMALVKQNLRDRCNQYDKQFTEVDKKLARDYDKLNNINLNKVKENGIAKGREMNSIFTRAKTKYIVYIVGSILSILIAIDKIQDISSEKVKSKTKVEIYKE